MWFVLCQQAWGFMHLRPRQHDPVRGVWVVLMLPKQVFPGPQLHEKTRPAPTPPQGVDGCRDADWVSNSAPDELCDLRTVPALCVLHRLSGRD